jgi:hypothetical protein
VRTSEGDGVWLTWPQHCNPIALPLRASSTPFAPRLARPASGRRSARRGRSRHRKRAPVKVRSQLVPGPVKLPGQKGPPVHSSGQGCLLQSTPGFILLQFLADVVRMRRVPARSGCRRVPGCQTDFHALCQLAHTPLFSGVDSPASAGGRGSPIATGIPNVRWGTRLGPEIASGLSVMEYPSSRPVRNGASECAHAYRVAIGGNVMDPTHVRPLLLPLPIVSPGLTWW